MTALLAPAPERETSHARALVPRDHPASRSIEGTVRHRRFVPTLREFAPKLFLAYLDVDALPGSLDRLPLWSARRSAPVRFRRRDFFDGSRSAARRRGARPRARHASAAGRRGLSISSRSYARSAGCSIRSPSTTAGRPMVGHSTRSCSRSPTRRGANGTGTCSTPGGMGTTTPRRRRCTSRRFCRWTSTTGSRGPIPGAELNLRIEVERDGTPVFDAELALRRTTARSPTRAVTRAARYPLLPLRVSARSIAQAVRLFAAADSAVPSSLPTAGEEEPMNSTTSPPGRLARAVVMQLLKRLTGGTLDLVDPSGTRASAPPQAVALRLDVTVRRARSARLRPRPARGERRARRVVRRRLVGHRRPDRLPAPRAPEPGSHARGARPCAPARYAPSSIPIARRRRADKHRDVAQRPRALRPRQRVLPTHPRRHDDVLVRRVRTAGRFARRQRPCAKLDRLARLLELGARRSRARDRNRLGRLRCPRGHALRLPRHDDDDLRTPVRVRDGGASRTRASTIS